MTIASSTYLRNFSLVASALTNNKFDENSLELSRRLRDSIHSQSLDSASRERTTNLCGAVDYYLTRKSINDGLSFRERKPFALVSGAGIAGLAASIVLRTFGFNTLVVESRRGPFTRDNVINLDVSIENVLGKYGLLEKFKQSVAARISDHNILLFEKGGDARSLCVSDVSDLKLDKSTSVDPENYHNLFGQDGVYSARIGDIQTFFANTALDMGVHILEGIKVGDFSQNNVDGVPQVRLTTNSDLVYDDLKLRPNLIFIAEGAHSATADKLGLKQETVEHSCNGENWIFGNMRYSGKKTFVISVVDASEKDLQIANLIFNSRSHVLNIAVTSKEVMSDDEIRERILKTAERVLTQKVFPVEETDFELLSTCKNPVHIVNRKLNRASNGPSFCLGDTIATSSPLAGLGGTLAVLSMGMVEQVAQGYFEGSGNLNERFERAANCQTEAWMNKSAAVKGFCVKTFSAERNSSSQGTSE